MSHVTRDTWHVTSYTQWVVNIVSQFQVSTSNGLWFMIFDDLEEKDHFTKKFQNLTRHKYVDYDYIDSRFIPGVTGFLFSLFSLFLTLSPSVSTTGWELVVATEVRWQSRHTCVQVYRSTGLQLNRCTGVQLYRSTRVQVNSFTALHVCRCTALDHYM